MITREARHLSGNDVGKTFKAGKKSGRIMILEFDGQNVEIYSDEHPRSIMLDYSTPVQITGTEETK